MFFLIKTALFWILLKLKTCSDTTFLFLCAYPLEWTYCYTRLFLFPSAKSLLKKNLPTKYISGYLTEVYLGQTRILPHEWRKKYSTECVNTFLVFYDERGKKAYRVRQKQVNKSSQLNSLSVPSSENWEKFIMIENSPKDLKLGTGGFDESYHFSISGITEGGLLLCARMSWRNEQLVFPDCRFQNRQRYQKAAIFLCLNAFR